jgi:hypothetical protein
MTDLETHSASHKWYCDRIRTTSIKWVLVILLPVLDMQCQSMGSLRNDDEEVQHIPCLYGNKRGLLTKQAIYPICITRSTNLILFHHQILRVYSPPTPKLYLFSTRSFLFALPKLCEIPRHFSKSLVRHPLRPALRAWLYTKDRCNVMGFTEIVP